MRIDFDPVSHAYQLDGVPVPSVTQVLQVSGRVDSQWYTEEARDRGVRVHAAAAAFDLEDADYLLCLGPGEEPYLDAWSSFRQDTGFYPVLVEQRVGHADYLYAGTLDRVGWLNGRLVLLDLKSGGCPAWTAVQTAAYLHAVEYMVRRGLLPLPSVPEARFGVQLGSDGKYRLHAYHNYDLPDFLGDLGKVQAKLKEVAA